MVGSRVGASGRDWSEGAGLGPQSPEMPPPTEGRGAELSFPLTPPTAGWGWRRVKFALDPPPSAGAGQARPGCPTVKGAARRDLALSPPGPWGQGGARAESLASARPIPDPLQFPEAR